VEALMADKEAEAEKEKEREKEREKLKEKDHSSSSTPMNNAAHNVDHSNKDLKENNTNLFEDLKGGKDINKGVKDAHTDAHANANDVNVKDIVKNTAKEAETENQQSLEILVHVQDTVQWVKPPVIAFKLLVENGPSSFTIYRTANDMADFHQQLIEEFPEIQTPLPELTEKKKILRNTFTKKNQKDNLTKYFKSLLPDPLGKSKVFQEFIKLRHPDDVAHKTKPLKVTADDFEILKVIGQGCMGKVFLVRKRDQPKRYYALKVIDKEWVLLQKELEHTKAERDILAAIGNSNNPFLVTLHYSFQSETDLFLVLDYCRGGDLASQLSITPRFLEDRARFYAAEIVLGLEELHKRGIIYRDLKPENCLLDDKGHLILTDFGLSKKFLPNAKPTTKTFCGTAEYLAPEILRSEEYSYAVDWWSLGAFLYEMLCGITPFFHDNHQEMYRRVLFAQLTFTNVFSTEAKHLISSLLDRNPKTRLGCRLRGVSEIKEHPFFKPIDWVKLFRREINSPWQPKMLSDEDVSNFDEYFTQQSPRLESRPREIPLSETVQQKFEGFSYENSKLLSYLDEADLNDFKSEILEKATETTSLSVNNFVLPNPNPSPSSSTPGSFSSVNSSTSSSANNSTPTSSSSSIAGSSRRTSDSDSTSSFHDDMIFQGDFEDGNFSLPFPSDAAATATTSHLTFSPNGGALIEEEEEENEEEKDNRKRREDKEQDVMLQAMGTLSLRSSSSLSLNRIAESIEEEEEEEEEEATASRQRRTNLENELSIDESRGGRPPIHAIIEEEEEVIS